MLLYTFSISMLPFGRSYEAVIILANGVAAKGASKVRKAVLSKQNFTDSTFPRYERSSATGWVYILKLHGILSSVSNMSLLEYVGLFLASLVCIVLWLFFRSNLSHIPGPPSASWWKGEWTLSLLLSVSHGAVDREYVAVVQSESMELPRILVQDVRDGRENSWSL